jgi:hypothetical protein
MAQWFAAMRLMRGAWFEPKECVFYLFYYFHDCVDPLSNVGYSTSLASNIMNH